MTVIDAGSRDEGDLDEGSAAEHVHGICLKTGPPRRVGVELEWLVRDVRDPALPVPAGRTAAAVAAFGAAARDGRAVTARDSRAPAGRGTEALPGAATALEAGSPRARPPGATPPGAFPPGAFPPGGGSQRAAPAGGPWVAGPAGGLPSSTHPGILPSGALLTAEPGGQLEISSQPADSLAELISATQADLDDLGAALAAYDLELAGIGLDPLRPPRRVLDLPRYAAMEAFFDSGGPWGRQMMCGTASVQVCLDAGDDSDGPGGYRWRWRLLHALGPVLVGAFANSPLREGRPTGWASSRQQVWSRMDPGRTRPPRLDREPRDAWAAYALDARLMCVRGADSADWSAPPGLTLRDWLRGGSPRWPTREDVDYHLSTLFPPVRPRGHFELRMIDAQPGAGWVVPLAVCWALLADEQAGEAALAAVAPLWNDPGLDGPAPGLPVPGPAGMAALDTGRDGPWLRAARFGPADPATARASRDCFAAAREALDRMAVPAAVTAPVDAFIARYVSQDRCPADDLLEVAT
jgi:glutamate--cysteine ligase